MIEMDWQNPNYESVLAERRRKLARLRADPSMLPVLRELYKRVPALWVNDWCVTYDPRNPERGLPSFTPFVLMPFQVRWLGFVLENWRCGRYNLTEKAREQGLSWLAVCFAVWLCIFHNGVRVGFGSYKAELVDELGNPGSLLEKMRILLRNLPREFRAGWSEEFSKRNQIDFPETRSACTGQTGDNVGRGDRTSIYFVDEAAHLERPLLVDASLSATTNCRCDISSVKGFANPFAQKVHEGKLPVFRASYLDDLRKGPDWKEKMIAQYGETIFGQEFGADYMAGVDGQVIPGRWLSACIDAHKKLGIRATGQSRAGLDIATTGQDLNALAIRRGVVLQRVSVWTEPHVRQSAARALRECAELECTELSFDGIGAGYSVGEFMDGITAETEQKMYAQPFIASEAPENPTAPFPGGTILNENLLANKKSQGAWNLRRLVENTYRAVNGDATIDLDEILSIDSATVQDVNALIAELSQPTYSVNTAGKIVVDKAPEGTRSPNRFDATMIAFFPWNGPLNISPDVIASLGPEGGPDPYGGTMFPRGF
jgi:phage terminase large subunit